MLHKCPNCNISLIPVTRVRKGYNTWSNNNLSAEKAMHLEAHNYNSWKCPECDMPFLSEIEGACIHTERYIDLEKALRKIH